MEDDRHDRNLLVLLHRELGQILGEDDEQRTASGLVPEGRGSLGRAHAMEVAERSLSEGACVENYRSTQAVSPKRE
jgi:hypothetical protein